MHQNSWRVLVLVLCQVLALQPVLAQQTTGLSIVVLEGAGAKNVVQQIAPKPIIVRVQDAGGRPVADATVIFTTPRSGASGEFENDSNSISVTTGADGIAAAGSFHPNAVAGKYEIQVRAESQGLTIATARIPQENIAEKKGRGKLIAILAVAGAAAGAAIASRSAGKDPSPETPSTGPTITFGGSAVGAPQP